MEASVQLPGAAARYLKGAGYVDHTRSTIKPKELANQWVRFRGLRGERGVLGLPVLLALQTMRWKADGTFESGFRSQPKSARKSNLCFEGADVVTEAGFREGKLNLHLDTGASETLLFPKFAEEFASIVSESGQKGSKQISGVGQSVKVDAVSLPLVTLEIGGLDTYLRPAQVVLKEVGSRWLHGRLGLDLLRQARAVTIDFRSMTLALD